MNTIKFENVQPVQQSARNFDLKYKEIESVYYGIIDACTCGCNGDYSYTKHYAEYKAQVEGNELLLPIADDKQVERLLKGALEHSHKAKFFNSIGGGYCIKVPAYTEWNESIGRDVQMGYIINLHWTDFKLKQPIKTQ